MGQADQITLIIQAEVDKAIGQMNKFNKTLGATDKSTSKTEKSMMSARKVMTGLAVAAGVLYTAYRTMIKPASDLEEAHSKFTVVFGENVDAAEEWAEVLVDSYAMSTREAYQYLSAVQDLLKPMGIAPQLAAEMSNEVVKLAADLGSFNNVPTDRVIQDINSALVGNFETMKKYGVVLNETTIKQEAMNMGLWDGKGVIDASTKAQVAFALSLKGSADAQGDMIRTGESWANIQKKIGARLENMGATLGAELLPALKSLGNLFLDVTKDGGVLMETLKGIVEFIGWVAAGINKLNAMSTLRKHNDDAERYQRGLGLISEETKNLRNEANKTMEAHGGLTNALLSSDASVVASAKTYQSRLDKLSGEYKKVQGLFESANDAHIKGIDTAKEKFGEEKKAVDGMVAAREAEKAAFQANELAKNESAKSGASTQLEARKVAQQAFNDFMKGSNAETSADLETHYETILELDGISNEQRLEAYQAYLEQKKEMEMQDAQDAMMLMQTTSQGIQNILSLVNKRKNIMLDKQYKKEKAAIVNNVKDEGERKKQLEALDQKFEAKRTALRKEQAKEEKAMALMNAVINTAAGITAALTVAPPVGYILAGITAAMGAAQIGLIAATPIPAAEGALIQGSQSGTLMQAGEGGASEAIIPLENEEAMEKLEPILGGGGSSIIINVENLYATEDIPETMAIAIDQALLDLKQNDNSGFSTAIEDK